MAYKYDIKIFYSLRAVPDSQRKKVDRLDSLRFFHIPIENVRRQSSH